MTFGRGSALYPAGELTVTALSRLIAAFERKKRGIGRGEWRKRRGGKE